MPQHYHRCPDGHTALIQVAWDMKVTRCTERGCDKLAERVYLETSHIARDEIPGGVTCENYGPEPVTFHSHSERRAYMAAHGLVEKDTFSPFPGTDIDPAGIPNPKGYMDPQTLENVRVLLSRESARDEGAVDMGAILRDMKVEVFGDDEEGRELAKLSDEGSAKEAVDA